MTYNLVLNVVVARLDDLRNATNEIIDGINRGKLQHCKEEFYKEKM